MCSSTSYRKRKHRKSTQRLTPWRRKRTCLSRDRMKIDLRRVSHTDSKCGALRRGQRGVRRDRRRLRHRKRRHSFAFQDLQGFLQPIDLLVAVAKRGSALLAQVLQVRDDGSKL